MKKRFFLVYKPFGMLSQFTGEEKDLLLGDLQKFPKDVYPVGRLDKDSEGLLLLTNDNQLKNKILDPKNHTTKKYTVQVDGAIDESAIQKLTEGSISINHKGKKHRVAKAKARIISPPNLPERIVPIRVRKNIPTSWIELEITEGKNRQVRKMTAATGFPTLRLVRTQIGHLKLDHLMGQSVVELKEKDITPFYS
jgi:23S rRNA pseudouridine2457 synthase